MDKKEIKQAMEFLRKQVENYMKEKDMHERKAYETDKKRDEVQIEILRIRSKCKHTYIGKPQTMMGRGICEICGDNDY